MAHVEHYPYLDPDLSNIEAACQRYLELDERDTDVVNPNAAVNPETLETNLTPGTIKTATDYFGNPSLMDDWKRLADAINTDSLEGRGLHESVTYGITHLELAKAQLHEDWDQVRECQWSLYGELYSDQMFTDTIHDTLAHLATFNAAEYPDTYKVAQHIGPIFEDIVGDRKRDPNATTSMTPQAKTDIGQWIDGKMGHILEGIDPDKLYSPTEVVDVFQRTITLLPESFEGTQWRSEIDTTITIDAPRCSSTKELVRVPATMSPLSGTRLREYAIHETYGHAKRSAGGKRNNSPLTTHMTAKNLQFEESMCVLIEDAPFPNATGQDFSGVASYLITGLALGALGTTFDRRQILSLTRDVVHSITARRKGRDLTPAEQEQRTHVVTDSLARTFPGIPVNSRGIADMRPLSYYFGRRKVAPLLNKISESGIVAEGMEWLLSGMFNPYYADDRTIVGRYHPMPGALQPFFAEAEQ